MIFDEQIITMQDANVSYVWVRDTPIEALIQGLVNPGTHLGYEDCVCRMAAIFLETSFSSIRRVAIDKYAFYFVAIR